MAELDAMIKGVNMALEWQMKILHLRTDSLTVFHWISDALSGKARLRNKASSEMLIRRRVGTFKALLDEYGLTVDVKFVRSENNRADVLTRVPQRWLGRLKRTLSPYFRNLPLLHITIRLHLTSQLLKFMQWLARKQYVLCSW